MKKKLPAVALDFDGSSSSKKKVIPVKTCYNATMLTRLAKIALIASIAFLMTLVALNNVTDYDSNFQFVRHVMSMDTTFPENRLMWRAIISPVWHHIFLSVHYCLGGECSRVLLDRRFCLFSSPKRASDDVPSSKRLRRSWAELSPPPVYCRISQRWS